MPDRLVAGRVVGYAGVPVGMEYGLWIGNGGVVVVNESNTVIIDGTSEMYRLEASGTISNTIGAATSPTAQSAWTDVTVAGTYSATPAHLSHIATTTGNGAPRTIGRLISWSAISSPFVLTALTVMDVTTLLTGDDCIVRFGGHNVQGSAQTWYAKYDVLSKAAL